MSTTESMSGKYWKTCSKDITSSEGWFKKILLLGLVSFVPVFGQMTLQGYAYEWAHKAAWGVAGPMPKKIYGRANSPLLRWGWFAFAIGFIISLIPAVIVCISSFMVDAGLGISIWAMYDPSYYYHGAVGAGSGIMLVIGVILMIVGFVASFAAYVLTWVCCMRMTAYNKFGAGMQLGKAFKMIKHDFGGIMRIFGMYLLTALIIVVIVTVIMCIVMFVVLFGAVALGVASTSGFHAMSESHAAGMIIVMVLMVLLLAFPFILACVYIELVMLAWQTLLVTRAVGYWTAQFDIAHWGRMEDPMPFEVNPPAVAQSVPQQPQQGAVAQPVAQGQVAAQQPASAPQVAQPTPAPAPQAQPVFLQEPAAQSTPSASESAPVGSPAAPEAPAVPETPASEMGSPAPEANASENAEGEAKK